MLGIIFVFDIYPPEVGQVLEFCYMELGICPLAGAMGFGSIRLQRSCRVAKTSLSGKPLAVRQLLMPYGTNIGG